MTNDPVLDQVSNLPALGAVVPAALRPTVAAEYVKDFDLARVAEMFNTTQAAIRATLNSEDTQKHMTSQLGDVSALGAVAARRLLEALLQEAMGSAESKGRTEARKLLARHFLPTRTETKSEHHFYVQTPGKLSPEEWAEKHSIAPPTLDAELIDDDETVLDAELIDVDAADTNVDVTVGNVDV